jgi:hypothetical protein
MLEMHQTMPSSIVIEMVKMLRIDRLKAILIPLGQPTFTIRNEMIGDMKVKVRIMLNLVFNLMNNQEVFSNKQIAQELITPTHTNQRVKLKNQRKSV